MGVRETRFEAPREFRTAVDAAAREPRLPTIDKPAAPQQLDQEPASRSLFARAFSGGLSVLDRTVSGLQKVRSTATSLRDTSFSTTLQRTTEGTAAMADAPVFQHKQPAVNQDREATPASTHINVTLFQVNVNNEKGPGLASQVVNTFAGAVGSLTAARHSQEEVKTDPAKASTLSGHVLDLGAKGFKLGAQLLKKHVFSE